MTDRFDIAAQAWRPELVALIARLIPEIGDDYRASDDPCDDTPAMQITIACDDDLAAWVYQTGDNSYTGACYGCAHWGVGTIYRDSVPETVADELLSDLGEQWASNPDNTDEPEPEPSPCDTCGANPAEQMPCVCAMVESGELVALTAPGYWASYLINGDASGLEDTEQSAADAWLESLADTVEPGGPCDCRDAGFRNSPDSGGLAAECQTYYFHAKR